MKIKVRMDDGGLLTFHTESDVVVGDRVEGLCDKFWVSRYPKFYPGTVEEVDVLYNGRTNEARPLKVVAS